jgi:site-specific DNA-methyltransferase (adenine-specific)
MPDNIKKSISSIPLNPLETYPGLNINDLNKYLPAIRTVEDINMTSEKMSEGMFLSKCLNGIQRLPNDSIDLIIADPPQDIWNSTEENLKGQTLQQYYEWNNLWLGEAHRVLKNTGAIYIFTPWQYSGMYHGLLSNLFKVQSRITWRKESQGDNSKTWKNQTSDIWYATKTDGFLFRKNPVGVKNENINQSKYQFDSNLWIDLPYTIDDVGRYPKKLFERVLEASSFKLNWVLDPFMGYGDVAVTCKKSGRRFIGFETNKDHLLLGMKRVDNS